MSWSLQIQNGDLAVSGNSYAQVTGAKKLVQDLSCAIKTPIGTDDLHPTYGSTIDGGTPADGVYRRSLIGGPNDASTIAAVEAEISRVARDYQTSQVARSRDDGVAYGKTTLDPDEILVNVVGIASQSVEDALLATVTVQTAAGVLPISLPITASG